MSNALLTTWHQLIKNADPSGLDDILADDATFHSPVVHTPQLGKALTKMYLSAAFVVLAGEQFRYVREVVGEREAVLEFKTVVDGIEINGVDIISWNDEGKISEFKVMVRPLKAINMLHQKMREMLEAG